MFEKSDMGVEKQSIQLVNLDGAVGLGFLAAKNTKIAKRIIMGKGIANYKG